jgi:hypothetical protein
LSIPAAPCGCATEDPLLHQTFRSNHDASR